MKILIGIPVLLLSSLLFAPILPQVPTGFDNKSNGLVDDVTHTADQAKFDEIEQISDGLGPIYNAQSCRECHQNPTSGGSSQVNELRVGHNGPHGEFVNPEIPIALRFRWLWRCCLLHSASHKLPRMCWGPRYEAIFACYKRGPAGALKERAHQHEYGDFTLTLPGPECEKALLTMLFPPMRCSVLGN